MPARVWACLAISDASVTPIHNPVRMVLHNHRIRLMQGEGGTPEGAPVPRHDLVV